MKSTGLKKSFFIAIIVFIAHLAFLPNFKAGHIPAGDEPEYLLMARSIWQDGDIDLANNVPPGERETYCSRGKVRHSGLCDNGRMLPIHNIGLPLLLAPIVAAGGDMAAVVFMLLIGSLIASEIFLFLSEFDTESNAAMGIVFAICFSPPLGVYSFLIYTETIVALIVLRGMRMLLSDAPLSTPKLLSLGALLAFLPWLHYGHAATAAVILCIGAAMKPPRARFALPMLIVSAAILAAAFFQWKVYGRFSLAIHEKDNLVFSPAGFVAILFDRSMGILFAAPFYLLHFAGWAELRIRNYGKFRILAAVVLALYLLTCLHAGWWKAWAPPGRRLVMFAPLLAAPMGAMLSRAFRNGRNAVFYFFMTFCCSSVIAGMLMINYSFAFLVNREGRGVNEIFALFPNPGLLNAIFPSYIEPGPGIVLQTVAWALIFIAANAWIYIVSGLPPRNRAGSSAG